MTMNYGLFRTLFVLLSVSNGSSLLNILNRVTFPVSDLSVRSSTTRLYGIRREIQFEPNQIEILRILGRIDIVTESESTADIIGTDISIRIFEAKLYDGRKCFMKEYSPSGMTFGKREQATSRKLLSKWVQMYLDSNTNTASSINNNEINNNNNINSDKQLSEGRYLTPIDDPTTPYFPIILGSLVTDVRIEASDFRSKWSKRFPSSKPPNAGNLWLVYEWSDATFKNLKRFPPLPQIIEGLDYFNKNSRIKKRWMFIRKVIRKTLETVDKFHRIHGYCHNSLSSECIWLTTTNQLEIENVDVVISELGSCQKLQDLGPYAKKAVYQDLYNLGFIFLELIVSSFIENNVGAQKIRALLEGSDYRVNILAKVEDMDYSQLRKSEWQSVFENLCNSDFQQFRELIKSIPDFHDSTLMLEADQGLAWRLVLYLLASGSGRLYDEDKQTQLSVTAKTVLKEFKPFFKDTF